MAKYRILAVTTVCRARHYDCCHRNFRRQFCMNASDRAPPSSLTHTGSVPSLQVSLSGLSAHYLLRLRRAAPVA
eukprot:3769619-Pleurochrysis_carterae.AAC.1